MSRIAIIGDTHGKIDRMIEKASAADLIIQVGDFGTFISPERMDKATRKHDGLGDLFDYYEGRKRFPFPVYFVKGNHEDFEILEEIKRGVIPNLHYMENGNVYTVGGLMVGALGGNYSPARHWLDREHHRLRGRKRKHFNHQDVSALRNLKLDVIIAHDAPQGIGLSSRYGGEPGSLEITELIEETQPEYYFFGHYHRYHEAKIGMTRVICLGILDGKSQDIFLLETE